MGKKHRIGLIDRRRFEQVARWAFAATLGVVTSGAAVEAIESILARLKREANQERRAA